MMRVLRGDRLDALLDAMLAEFDRVPLPPPQRELVVVQGRGLDRWISQQAALRRGGWGFAETLYPRPFLLRAFAAVCDGAVPRRIEDDGWLRIEFELRIAALLPELRDDARLAPIASAWRATPHGSIHDAALDAAPAIAEVLDRCAQHRVEMVTGWMRGESPEPRDPDEAWLSEVWRRIAAKSAPSRLVVDRDRFRAACAGGCGVPSGLPPRVSIFGVSTLAPAFLELLAALAHRVEITVYALDPCRGRWDHPLASGWGVESIEFDRIVAEMERRGEARLERQSPAPDRSIGALGALRARIRGERSTEPTERGAAFGSVLGAASCAEHDDTLQLLACRGRLREVERVHDALAALLASDPSIEPRDMAILTPDLRTYGPMVEAVFGARRDARGRPLIPFAVADRDRDAIDASETLARMIESALGRAGRSEVLELLTIESIGSALGFGATELERVRCWCEMAQVRWGLDAGHRAAHGRPGETIGTWQWGLDRLRLGAVMAEGAQGALGETEPVAPVTAVELGELPMLEELARFLEALSSLARRAKDALPIVSAASLDAPSHEQDDWISLIDRLVAETLERGEMGVRAAGLVLLRARLAEIRRAAIDAGFVEPHRVRARTAMRFVLERIRAEHPGRALLASGVTVAALQPMRSIPFKVIALVGMADGLIPRRVSAPSFDLVARERRPGDRDGRLDDRQVMLETMMAASRALIVAWPGVDPTTGGEQPPSVLIGELVDAMPALETRKELTEEHAEAPMLVREAAIGAAPPRDASAPRDSNLPRDASAAREAVSDSPTLTMSLDSLQRFWRSPPAAYLKTRRVMIEWEPRDEDEEDPVDREFEKPLLRELKCGDIPRVALEGQGFLPRGVTGPQLATELSAHMQEWRDEAARLVAALGNGSSLPAAVTPFSLEIDFDRSLAPNALASRVRLEGTIPILRGIGPLREIDREVKGQDRSTLWAWICLLAGVVADGGKGELVPQGLLMLGRKSKDRGSERQHSLDVRFLPAPPREEAMSALAQFVSLALEGERTPLAFMPSASLDFAHHCEKKPPEPDRAVALAREGFFKEGRDDIPSGDAFDAAVRILFGPERFFDASGSLHFERIATRIAIPAMRAFKHGEDRQTLYKRLGLTSRRAKSKSTSGDATPRSSARKGRAK